MTFGHVVVGASAKALDDTRTHERVHIRQYERWGPLFVPAYVASTAGSITMSSRLLHAAAALISAYGLPLIHRQRDTVARRSQSRPNWYRVLRHSPCQSGARAQAARQRMEGVLVNVPGANWPFEQDS
jgi:hypothetical protein